MDNHVKLGGLKISKEKTLLADLSHSNIAITFHAVDKGIGGLVHAAFPKTYENGFTKETLFADKAIDIMLGKLSKFGVKRSDVIAKIIAGKSLHSELEDNLLPVKEKLEQVGIEIGGNVHGRFVEFCPVSGTVNVETRL